MSLQLLTWLITQVFFNNTDINTFSEDLKYSLRSQKVASVKRNLISSKSLIFESVFEVVNSILLLRGTTPKERWV